MSIYVLFLFFSNICCLFIDLHPTFNVILSLCKEKKYVNLVYTLHFQSVIFDMYVSIFITIDQFSFL